MENYNILVNKIMEVKICILVTLNKVKWMEKDYLSIKNKENTHKEYFNVVDLLSLINNHILTFKQNKVLSYIKI
jgi:hypothetical protein